MSAECCPLSGYDGDPNDFESSSMVKARNVHKCCECRREVHPGEIYERFAAKSDGRIWTKVTCDLCSEVREHFSCGYGFRFGVLWDELRENFIPEMKAGGPCLEGLSAAAKERMFAEWRKWKGLGDGPETH